MSDRCNPTIPLERLEAKARLARPGSRKYGRPGERPPPGCGELVVEDDTGRLSCHFCGRWFTSLGSHVRAHGTTAERYRADLGLCRREPLTAKPLSSAISARQQQAYGTSPDVRERFAVGQQMARDGVLGRLSATGRSTEPLAPAAVARQRRALETGRGTVAAQRQAARAALIEESGAPDLATYPRTRYAKGASVERLTKDTGLGRDRLRVAMADAEIETRHIGANTAVGKRSRAVAAEEAAARRVGADNLRAWLTARRSDGWTLSQLGTAVGHSGHWVRWRLDTDPHLGPESLDEPHSSRTGTIGPVDRFPSDGSSTLVRSGKPDPPHNAGKAVCRT